MKKIMSILTIAALLCANTAAMAADKAKGEPDVIVDGSKILFSDQSAKIVDDITLVPARGVFEAMGCKVDWDGETRTVTVTSSTGVRYVTIVIDSDTMKISTYKSLMERTDSDFKLEVPAQIINDRTMIPLRAVSEAFDSEVSWDGEAYAVNITTSAPMLLEGYEPKPEVSDEQKPTISLSTDHEGELKAGDEVTVYVDVKNMPEVSYISSISTVFEYNKDELEYVEGSGSLLGDDKQKIAASVSAENTAYETGTKIVFININSETANKSGGHVYTATFKAKQSITPKITIGNAYDTELGYETSFVFSGETGDAIYDGDLINIINN